MAPSYSIPALTKTFDVIECLSCHQQGIGLSEISTLIGAPKSTVFRILRTLEGRSWVEKKGDLFFLGYMLIHYGLTTLAGRKIADMAVPVLDTLSEETGETSHLAVPSGRKSMILEVREATHHIKLVSTPGNLLPLYCTSHGKLFLAYIIGDDLEGFYFGEHLERYTENTITDLTTLKDSLADIRERGLSHDNMEYRDNVRCCAAPVFGSNGDCIGAVGVTGTTMTCTPDRIELIESAVKKAASAVSRQMGSIEN